MRHIVTHTWPPDVWVFVCVFVCGCVFMCGCLGVLGCVLMHARALCMRTQCMCRRMYVHGRVWTGCMYTCTFAYTHCATPHIHTHIHTHTYTHCDTPHIHTYTHTHTHTVIHHIYIHTCPHVRTVCSRSHSHSYQHPTKEQKHLSTRMYTWVPTTTQTHTHIKSRTYTHTHTHMHTHIYKHIRAGAPLILHLSIHTRTCVQTYAYTHVRAYRHMHTHIRTHLQTNTHTKTKTHQPTNAHIYMHTHIREQYAHTLGGKGPQTPTKRQKLTLSQCLTQWLAIVHFVAIPTAHREAGMVLIKGHAGQREPPTHPHIHPPVTLPYVQCTQTQCQRKYVRTWVCVWVWVGVCVCLGKWGCGGSTHGSHGPRV